MGNQTPQASGKFEQQIKRIHELIEQPGSEVVWNDHLPDPDNPTQPRQIDVSIKREGKLTLVECRIHKAKQDVKWIEELIGRRLSLKADAVIAVSSSGFTNGAIIKAKKFGIILRDLLTLTEEEVSEWGYLTRVWLTFYEFVDVQLVFRFRPEHLGSISVNDVEQYLRKSPGQLYGIFEMLANKIDEKNPKGYPGQFRANLHNRSLQIAGISVDSIEFIAKFSLREEEINIPSVVAYDVPGVEAAKRTAYIEKVDLGEFEITKSSNDVLVTLDLSPIEIPPNCKFHTVNFDFKRVITMQGVEIIGLPKMYIPLEKLSIVVAPV
jgi:hypothetical protein